MIVITVCIGSCCHLKGSGRIIGAFREKIKEHNLSGKVEIAGAFCMGNCTHAVSVEIGNEIYSVKPDTAATFFDDVVIPMTQA